MGTSLLLAGGLALGLGGLAASTGGTGPGLVAALVGAGLGWAARPTRWTRARGKQRMLVRWTSFGRVTLGHPAAWCHFDDVAAVRATDDGRVEVELASGPVEAVFRGTAGEAETRAAELRRTLGLEAPQ